MPVSTPPPSTGARPPDLSDEEFVELDDLLLETPEPLEPLDVVMLDGYLCGLLVQPVLVEQADWLPFVFDFDGRALPDNTDPAWMARTTALIVRRYEVLNRSLAEDGWFDPLILEEGEGTEPPEGEAADPMMAGLSEVSRPLMPWVAGFHHASDAFPALSELGEDDVMIAIARLFRHLPQEDDESRKLVEEIDREFPLESVDDAVAELVATVADLYELTAKKRYKVETVRRDTPKVGRNDPCFCGSGKKYKNCHGAS